MAKLFKGIGHVIPRVTGRLYCFECELFNVSPIALAGNGFNDWVHASERFK